MRFAKTLRRAIATVAAFQIALVSGAAHASGRTETSPWVSVQAAGKFALKKKKDWVKSGFYPKVSNLECKLQGNAVKVRATYEQSGTYLGNAYVYKDFDGNADEYKAHVSAFKKAGYQISGSCDLKNSQGQHFLMIIGNRLEKKPADIVQHEL